MLEKYILPTLQDVPIESIKPKHIIKILEPVKANGHFKTIKRICRVVNEVMRLAVAGGYIEVNYLADVTRTTKCLVEWQLCESITDKTNKDQCFSQLKLTMKR